MALGRIASPDAVDALRLALTGDSAESRAAAADASLTCAERLVAQGKRPEAIAMLEQVCAADVPKHVRTAAVYGLILARQSSDLSLFIAQLQSEDPASFAVALRAAPRLPGPDVPHALVAELDRLPSARQALGDRRLGRTKRCGCDRRRPEGGGRRPERSPPRGPSCLGTSWRCLQYSLADRRRRCRTTRARHKPLEKA